jgi:hypothetical protein
VTLRRQLLGFWALWFSVVVVTNLLDVVTQLGWAEGLRPLASGNYALIVGETDRWHLPHTLSALLFAGAIALEAAAAVLFWRAAQRPGERAFAVRAFQVSLALWMGFIVSGELLHGYGVEHVHLMIFGVQLVSLLAITLVES